MDRHQRPYSCDRPGCEARAFGDIGGLFRHQREVHKRPAGDRPITEYTCPDKTCERHTRGFPRRWNLLEHQRRIHSVGRVDSGLEESSARHTGTFAALGPARTMRYGRRSSHSRGVGISRPLSPVSPTTIDRDRPGYSFSPSTTTATLPAASSYGIKSRRHSSSLNHVGPTTISGRNMNPGTSTGATTSNSINHLLVEETDSNDNKNSITHAVANTNAINDSGIGNGGGSAGGGGGGGGNGSGTGGSQGVGNANGLRSTLEELESRKERVMQEQRKIDEAIDGTKRLLNLIESLNPSKNLE